MRGDDGFLGTNKKEGVESGVIVVVKADGWSSKYGGSMKARSLKNTKVFGGVHKW